MTADLIPIVDHGLGSTTWPADLGDGRARAAEASRDLRAVQQAALARAGHLPAVANVTQASGRELTRT